LDQEKHFVNTCESNVFALLEKLLRQEQASRYHQGRLEARIYSDSAAYQRLSCHYIQVEKKVAGLEYTRLQHEASLRLAAETCQTMSNDLHVERAKLVLELESRLADLYPSIEVVLNCLKQSSAHHVPQESMRQIQQLQEENRRQRDDLIQLQATLHIREEVVKDLRTTLAEAFLGFSAENRSSVHSDVPLEQDDVSSVDIVTVKTEGAFIEKE
jgi:hypothetical protein